MLDPVPLAGPGRQMADGDAQAEFIGQACSSRFHSRTRAPLLPPQSAVMTSRQPSGSVPAQPGPPAADALTANGRVGIDPDTDPASVCGEIIDAVRRDLPCSGRAKVVHPHRLGPGLRGSPGACSAKCKGRSFLCPPRIE